MPTSLRISAPGRTRYISMLMMRLSLPFETRPAMRPNWRRCAKNLSSIGQMTHYDTGTSTNHVATADTVITHNGEVVLVMRITWHGWTMQFDIY